MFNTMCHPHLCGITPLTRAGVCDGGSDGTQTRSWNEFPFLDPGHAPFPDCFLQIGKLKGKGPKKAAWHLPRSPRIGCQSRLTCFHTQIRLRHEMSSRHFLLFC